MKILDSEIDWWANQRRLYRDYRPHGLLVLITAIADAISTTLFMSVDSIDIELNPTVRWLSHTIGIVAGPLLGKLIQLIALWLIACMAIRLAKFLFWTVIALNSFAVAFNIAHYWRVIAG